MSKKKKNKKIEEEEIDGLSSRHVSQIIRRNMIQKNHGDGKKFKRKNRFIDEEDQIDI